MKAYGQGWRLDWSDFDGRTLRDQLDFLVYWAENPNRSADYTDGSDFLKEQQTQ